MTTATTFKPFLNRIFSNPTRYFIKSKLNQTGQNSTKSPASARPKFQIPDRLKPNKSIHPLAKPRSHSTPHPTPTTMSPKKDAGLSPPVAAPPPLSLAGVPVLTGSLRPAECADLLGLVAGVKRPLEDVVADFLARIQPERRLRFGAAINFVLKVTRPSLDWIPPLAPARPRRLLDASWFEASARSA